MQEVKIKLSALAQPQFRVVPIKIKALPKEEDENMPSVVGSLYELAAAITNKEKIFIYWKGNIPIQNLGVKLGEVAVNIPPIKSEIGALVVTPRGEVDYYKWDGGTLVPLA